MEELKNKIVSHLESRYGLEPTFIPEELREIRLPLGVFKMYMYNWRMEKVRKISVMRTTVRIPRLEIFAIEMYPETDYDIPLLAIDFSCMKKKTFVYMNYIPLFTDSEYHEKYIARLKPIYDRYTIGPRKEGKDWMLPYMTENSVYAMIENSLLDDARQCAWAYVADYLDMLDAAEKVTDPAYRTQVEELSLHYCDELSEKDGSRKMLGRFIGMERANRIFREVIR